MLELCAYEWDHPAVGTDVCLLHPDNVALLAAKYISLRKQDKDQIVLVTLAVNARPDVAMTDVVLHPCVHDTLRLRKCEIVIVSPVYASTAAAQVELQFDGFQSLIHWDDIPLSSGLFYLPNIWYQCWPESLKPRLVEISCELLLLGAALCNGALVTARYMDYILCFKVIIEGGEQLPRVGGAETKYTIRMPPSNASSSSSVAQPTKPKPEPACFQPTLSNITTLFQAIFMQNETQGIGMFSRSLIISAPAGGGKSCFLQSAVDWLREQYPSSSLRRGPQIKILSCEVIGKHSSVTLDETALGGNEQSAGRQLITNVLRLLGTDWPGPEQSDWDFTADGLVLVLDDLDSVFDQYSANRCDLTADPRTDPQRVFGYHLSRLLGWLATTSNPGRVLVLGATTRPPTQLLRAHTGCPEFERCLVLGSPTFSERALMLAYQLAESKLPLDAATVAEGVESADRVLSAEEVARVWAERLAGITAGYLPGDLRAVVQRIGLMHDGERAARSLRGGGTTRGAAGEESVLRVAWGTALEAVVSVVPKQLQQLDLGAGGGGGGGPRSGAASGRLSWSDFAGYPDIITDLQRRLKFSSAEVPPAAPTTDPSSSAVKPLQKVPLRGLVVHGPTGCGKTLLASVVAAEAKMNLVAVKSTELLSKYFGETESTIRNLFQKARAAAPCVLFFDDFDTLAHKRSAADAGDGATSNGLHGRILSTFLNELDGILGTGDGSNDGSSSGRVLVIIACQDVASLDEALVRPGRLHHHVGLRQPTVQDIAAIVELYMSKLNGGAEVSTARAAAVLAAVGASASEAESFATAVYTAALREAVAEVEDPAVVEAERWARRTRPRQIEQRHVDAALRDLLQRHELTWQDVEDTLGGDTTMPSDDTVVAPGFTAPGVNSGAGFEWSGGGFSAGV